MKKCMIIFFLLLFSGAWFAEVSAEETVSELFDRVSPAVVVIQTLEQGRSLNQEGKTVTQGGLGSGVVISKDGLILTAAHVVQVAHVIQVLFQSGETISAGIVGSVPSADVALLKLEKVPKDLVVAPMGNTDSVRVGDPTFVVGAPYGIDNTLTVGYVSGKRKPRGLVAQFVPVELIQTDAAINQGNSGGPMFNMAGEVIGIVSNILTQSGGFEGIGFGISINTARELLLEESPVWTGIETYLLTDELAAALNVPQKASILVQRVADMSPGYYLGLQGGKIVLAVGGTELSIGGDIILAVEGESVTDSPEQLRAIHRILVEHPDLKNISVTVLRNGQIVVLRRKD